MAENNEKKRVYGIDLGTTYSAISFINDDGKPEIIPNSDNERITPSVVFFEEPSEEGKVGNVIVGKIAKESARTDPNRVITFVKQEMGTGWTKELDGITLNPEKVSSYILRRLAGDAKTCANHDVQDVIITCPAYFGDAERKATKAAGEIAGLNVLQIIDEPVAAAMHYGLNKANGEGDRTAIVYDLGGGTFDVTVIAIEKGNVRVVCSDGNHRLGGKNWDERVVDYFASKFAEATGTDKDAVLGDTDTLYDLQLQAEIAKQTLTMRASAKVKVAFEGNTERIEITREQFDEMTKDLLDQTVELTQKMFDLAATKGVTKINDFLLVGGSTRMPQVMAMVKEQFASRVDTEPASFEVDEAVAKGAATFGNVKSVQAEIKEETVRRTDELIKEGASKEEAEARAEEDAIKKVADDQGLTLEAVKDLNKVIATTVASRSYGIRVLKAGQPVVFNMLKKQDQVPTSYEREFPVSDDNAEKLPLQVFANNVLESVAQLEESATVGDAVMMLPPGTPKGAMIRIKFTLTEEGVLSLDATDVASGTPVHAEFEAKDGLTKEQIEAARKETADLVIE